MCAEVANQTVSWCNAVDMTVFLTVQGLFRHLSVLAPVAPHLCQLRV